MAEEDFLKSEISTYMWHVGDILTSIMSVSDSTHSPIIVQTFQAASELFDTLGQYIYGSLPSENIFPILEEFIKSLDYKSDSNFKSVLEYSYDFSQDLLMFLKENNLNK